MERFTERSRKETVKGRLALRELEVKRQPFSSSSFLKHYQVSYSSWKNRIQGATTTVVQFYIT